MAENLRITRICAAYSRPDPESPELFRLEAGTVAALLRDEDRLFFKAAYGGQVVYIPKECAALTEEVSADERNAIYLKRESIAEDAREPTAEDITLPDTTGEYDYQVTGGRIVAAFIDFIPLLILFLVMAATMGEFGSTDDNGFSVLLTGGPAALFFLLAWAYYLLSESITGLTLGKWLMGLRVVKLDGEPYDLRAVLLRNIIRIVDVLPVFYLVGLISVAVSQKNQRLGDLAAGTLVVRTP